MAKRKLKMRVKGYKFSYKKCDKWFSDKNGLGELICEAKSIPEKETRLKWLSEGSLSYHINLFSGVFPSGGCKIEKDLFKDFVNQLQK